MEFREKFEVAVCCPCCGKYSSVFVERDDYYSWLRREKHIQDIFSYLSAPQREIILTGTCPECWNKLFKDVG